jgi:hypothetical protein
MNNYELYTILHDTDDCVDEVIVYNSEKKKI